jgi:hypothetical protein
MENGWRAAALAEIRSIKAHWVEKYGWAPLVEDQDGRIDLYVRFVRQAPRSGQPVETDAQVERWTLRLRYQDDFATAGRREAFVDPDDVGREGVAFWPTGHAAFKRDNSPPVICLEGTWGFHSFLHRERNGRQASLNKLLMEIQECLDQ